MSRTFSTNSGSDDSLKVWPGTSALFHFGVLVGMWSCSKSRRIKHMYAMGYWRARFPPPHPAGRTFQNLEAATDIIEGPRNHPGDLFEHPLVKCLLRDRTAQPLPPVLKLVETITRIADPPARPLALKRVTWLVPS